MPTTYRYLMIIAALLSYQQALADNIYLQNKEDYDITMAALITFTDEKKVWLKPGFEADAATDNQVFTPGKDIVFNPKGKINRYIVAEHYIGKTENRTLVTNVKLNKPFPSVFGAASRLRDSVVTIIDVNKVVSLPMENESLFTFSEGTHPDLPGFFIGTAIDLETGEVTGAYSGNVIFLTGFTITITE